MSPRTITPRDLINAFESGEYRKGYGRLRRDISSRNIQYCCLGVACEIAGAEYDPCESYPLYKVVGDYLYRTDIPWAPWLTPDMQSTLARVNDGSDTFDPVIEELEAIERLLEDG